MKTNSKFTVLIILLLMPFLMLSQTGTLKGKVTDKKSNLAISYANISASQNGSIVSVANTNLTGDYAITGLLPGKYVISVNYLGYNNEIKNNVEIVANKTTVTNFSLTQKTVMLQEIAVLNEEHLPISKTELKKDRGSSSISPSVSKIDCINSVSTNYINDEEHNTESYDYINENGFKSPLNSALSTFSIDVDVASYTNVRRYLNSGTIPPKDAIRVEEMINYFKYDYYAPSEKPFSIYTELGNCPWNSKHKLALIGIQGKIIDMKNAPNSNLVFLIDVSGSMSSANKLPLLKSSLRLLVNQLTEKDKISIVVYAGSAGLVLNSTTCNNKEQIIDALDKLQAGGSTAGGEGIKLAYKIAKENFIKDGNNRIILATDGDFNVGVSSDSDMQHLIELNRKSGVYITVLGFGMGNYKDSKMEKIADNGNGNYAYIDNLLEAQKVLVNEIGGTLLTIAKDVKLQIEFNPENVQAYRLIGYENRLLNNEDFNNDQKDAGELGAGKTVTALYEIIPTGIKSDFDIGTVNTLKYQQKETTKTTNKNELFSVKIRYKLPQDSTSKLISDIVLAKQENTSKQSNNFNFASAVAQFGMLLRNSEYKGNSSYKSIYNLALNSKGQDIEGYRSEFLKLVKLAESIDNRQFVDQLEH